MNFKKALHFTAIAAVSIPFALWFWLSWVDIGALPFKSRFWQVKLYREDKPPGSDRLTGVTLVSALSYTDVVRCTMTSTITEIGDDVYMGFRYDVQMPPLWPDYIHRKAIIGCANFAAEEIERRADAEEAARARKHESGRI